jgi:hypothetical protein
MIHQHNWKKRFNIKFKNFSGEGGSADDIIIDRWFSHLSQLLKQYDSQFVYNLDETGLYWKAGKGKSFITGTFFFLINLIVCKTFYCVLFSYSRGGSQKCVHTV